MSLMLLSISPLNVVPVAGVDRAPTTAFAAEVDTLFPGTPISVPVPMQLGSASDRGLETTVSGQFVFTIAIAIANSIANYWYLAYVFGHPKAIIALVARRQNESIHGIRTKSLCGFLKKSALNSF
jgi:hypothetical protein